jgi:hypothetical protein
MSDATWLPCADPRYLEPGQITRFFIRRGRSLLFDGVRGKCRIDKIEVVPPHKKGSIGLPVFTASDHLLYVAVFTESGEVPMRLQPGDLFLAAGESGPPTWRLYDNPGGQFRSTLLAEVPAD